MLTVVSEVKMNIKLFNSYLSEFTLTKWRVF